MLCSLTILKKTHLAVLYQLVNVSVLLGAHRQASVSQNGVQPQPEHRQDERGHAEAIHGALRLQFSFFRQASAPYQPQHQPRSEPEGGFGQVTRPRDYRQQSPWQKPRA